MRPPVAGRGRPPSSSAKSQWTDSRRGKSRLVKQGGDIVGIRLGNLSPGSSVQVELDYRLPQDFGSLSETEPSLRVEVFKAQLEAGAGEVK